MGWVLRPAFDSCPGCTAPGQPEGDEAYQSHRGHHQHNHQREFSARDQGLDQQENDQSHKEHTGGEEQPQSGGKAQRTAFQQQLVDRKIFLGKS